MAATCAPEFEAHCPDTRSNPKRLAATLIAIIAASVVADLTLWTRAEMLGSETPAPRHG
jgi:hypothetical protein